MSRLGFTFASLAALWALGSHGARPKFADLLQQAQSESNSSRLQAEQHGAFGQRQGRGSSFKARRRNARRRNPRRRTPEPTPAPPVRIVDVHVIVRLDPNGFPNGARPWYDLSHGTLANDSDGNVTQSGSLGTDLTQNDIIEIFEGVNELYEGTFLEFKIKTLTFTKPTVPCGNIDGVRFEKETQKTRSSGYFTKWWGTFHPRDKTPGNGYEKPSLVLLDIPNELFETGKFHIIYQKWVGHTGQGFVTGLRNLAGPTYTGGKVMVGVVGQWTNKWDDDPIKRPNTLTCSRRRGKNCGRGLHYTTAHELGHLLGIRHNDTGVASIMDSGGQSWEASRFTPEHVKLILNNAGPTPDESWGTYMNEEYHPQPVPSAWPQSEWRLPVKCP